MNLPFAMGRTLAILDHLYIIIMINNIESQLQSMEDMTIFFLGTLCVLGIYLMHEVLTNTHLVTELHLLFLQ